MSFSYLQIEYLVNYLSQCLKQMKPSLNTLKLNYPNIQSVNTANANEFLNAIN